VQPPREIEVNFDNFSALWRQELDDALGSLARHRSVYLDSYKRLASLNAWREMLLSNRISSGSLGFFLEAQNDALVSHVLARMGSWRAALKALRSSVENVLACLYYKDHPVELELWEAGKHKIEFGELWKYFSRHPKVVPLGIQRAGLIDIRNEYSTLSRAVHGFASFRMTGGAGSTALWSDSRISLGAWSTRERRTVCGVNLLLLAIFGEELEGTRLPGLRSAIGLAVPRRMHQGIRTGLHVNLRSA
jgi:hypothetical protein